MIRNRGFYKTVFLIALPMVLQGIINIGVNIMDTVMLGSFGEIQISASSLANNYFDIFHILCMGIGGGAGVLIAQYWGTGNREGIRRVNAIMFRACFIASVLFTLLAALAPSGIMSVYTSDMEVIEKGRLYLLVSLPTFFLQGATLVMTLSLRAMRKVSVAFFASFISFFVNIFFNWVFIFGKLGAPRLEIVGAALGTVIARAVEMVVIGVYFLCVEKDIRFRIRDIFRPCADQLPLYLHYGFPVIVSDLLLTLGNNVLSVIMGHISTSFVAAFSIVVPVMRLCNVFTRGLSSAASTMTGNIIGTGDYSETQKCGTTLFGLSVLTGIGACILLLICCPYVIGLYNVTFETQQIAMQLMDAVAILLIFQSVESVLTKGVLRGGGDTRFVMVADVLFLWIVSIPLGYLCGIVWKLSPFIVYLALRADFPIKSVWCAARLFQGKWIRKIVTAEVDT